MSATRKTRRARHGFSLVEMLVALAISSMLLTATLVAFDASWRGYKMTTESASTNVVARIVIHRMLAMIRTGTEFGPYPNDYFDPDQNPVTSTYIEFQEPNLVAAHQITRIERRDATGGGYELWYVLLDSSTQPATIVQERPLLRDLAWASFIMKYDPGPRLVRATIDLTIRPNDYHDMKINVGGDTPLIRLVASAEPRQLQQ